MSLLFEPTKLGEMQLKNKIVMAPMTRSRALKNLANDLMAEYYKQRAGAGLIITEGISPSPNGLGYARIPGLFNEEQSNAWKKVTHAVHQQGGKIFAQLMHTGRVGHPLNLPSGAQLLGPSSLAAPGQMWTDNNGLMDHPVPQEMTEDQIQKAIQEFRRSSELAILAGFDGIELHGANGYLIDQFLNSASNQRQDRWGGSIENRIRFAVEVAKTCSETIGANKVGMRISPYGVFNGMQPDAEMKELYRQLILSLNKFNLVYIHIVDHSAMGAPPVGDEIKIMIRQNFKGAYILSGGYDLKKAELDLSEKKGELVAFGRPFISNPQLVEKLKNNLPLTMPDQQTFYTPGEKGYTDYL